MRLFWEGPFTSGEEKVAFRASVLWLPGWRAGEVRVLPGSAGVKAEFWVGQLHPWTHPGGLTEASTLAGSSPSLVPYCLFPEPTHSWAGQEKWVWHGEKSPPLRVLDHCLWLSGGLYPHWPPSPAPTRRESDRKQKQPDTVPGEARQNQLCYFGT